MARTLMLENAAWRKSTYSGDSGGDCVECAPLDGAAWLKSSYSGSSGGQCIECAPLGARIALRDSKNPDGGTFTVPPKAFSAFVAAAGRGEL
ncbi:DUF397 domain-containing protein [Streptomyces sp. cg28]|uniref:DUF397 domain-containing protein n=1 Tax=Streptomyces sp. cg28 TaxID=3403457 RepID=UPI003B215375